MLKIIRMFTIDIIHNQIMGLIASLKMRCRFFKVLFMILGYCKNLIMTKVNILSKNYGKIHTVKL